MNQNDQQLITRLSDQIKKTQPVTKDPKAAELIEKEIAAQPDALYLLTQKVLLQEAAIQQMQQQVSELQAHSKKGFFSSWFGRRQQPRPSYQSPPPGAQASPFGQGSFLGSALSTAAGVVGGMFLFEGIRHLFSGGSASASESMLNNPAMTDSLSDPLQGQDQMLNDGFGSGDSFMGDSGMGSDGGDFGSFDDGFGDGGW